MAPAELAVALVRPKRIPEYLGDRSWWLLPYPAAWKPPMARVPVNRLAANTRDPPSEHSTCPALKHSSFVQLAAEKLSRMCRKLGKASNPLHGRPYHIAIWTGKVQGAWAFRLAASTLVASYCTSDHRGGVSETDLALQAAGLGWTDRQRGPGWQWPASASGSGWWSAPPC